MHKDKAPSSRAPGGPEHWRGQIKADLEAQVEAGGTLYGFKPDGTWIARTGDGDRIIRRPDGESADWSAPLAMPTLHVVAGPNGCGKLTLTRTARFPGAEVIDPDAIVREIASGSPGQAAREALRRRRTALPANRTYLVETTLAGSGILRHMRDARDAGYRIELHYNPRIRPIKHSTASATGLRSVATMSRNQTRDGGLCGR